MLVGGALIAIVLTLIVFFVTGQCSKENQPPKPNFVRLERKFAQKQKVEMNKLTAGRVSPGFAMAIKLVTIHHIVRVPNTDT